MLSRQRERNAQQQRADHQAPALDTVAEDAAGERADGAAEDKDADHEAVHGRGVAKIIEIFGQQYGIALDRRGAQGDGQDKGRDHQRAHLGGFRADAEASLVSDATAASRVVFSSMIGSRR